MPPVQVISVGWMCIIVDFTLCFHLLGFEKWFPVCGTDFQNVTQALDEVSLYPSYIRKSPFFVLGLIQLIRHELLV